MRIIAFVTDAPAMKAILRYLGEPTTPPEVARAWPLSVRSGRLEQIESPRR